MPATEPPDVVVVGAGPAGAAAAVTLARRGRRVHVVDKATFPRDKCCGDGLTTAALRRAEQLGLRPADVASWQPVQDVEVVGADGSPLSLTLPRDGSLYAVTARRSDLDAALVDLAVSAGAEVTQGTAVTAVTRAASGRAVEVTLDDGRVLTAPYVIAADGMWSPVRRLLGLTPPGYLGEWQAGRQYLRSGNPLSRRLWVWFEPDLLPGYAWSFPLPDGTVNFGYAVIRDPANTLRGQSLDWRRRPAMARVLGPGAEHVGPWRSWPIPTGVGRAPLTALGGRVLLVGDAAGAGDPMTGEGIAQAMETAEMAGRALAQAGPDRPDLAARRYTRQIRHGPAVDDGLARLLGRVLARPGGAARALALVGRTDWGRRNFARWMFEDYPRAVLVTPHRWRSGLFRRPGAYGPDWSAPEATN